MDVAVFYGSAVLSGYELSPQVTALSETGFSREGASESAINFCNPDPHVLTVFLPSPAPYRLGPNKMTTGAVPMGVAV